MSTSTDGNAAPAALRTRNWFRLLGYSLTGLMTLVLVIYQIAMYESKQSLSSEKPEAPKAAAKPVVPLTTAPQAEWPRLHMPPNADVPIELPPGMKSVDVIGDNFSLVTKYADNTRCATSGEVKCKKGAVVEIRVENTVNTANTVLYAFNPY